MPDNFVFLPDARPAAHQNADAASSTNARLSVDYDVRITANGTATGPALNFETRLKGPGDVIGIDPDMISRIEPDTRARAFEPNYFPYLEFSDADFPWRFTLDIGAGTAGRRPWCAWIALKPEEYEVIPQGDGPLPQIQVTNARVSLPRPGHLKYMAHVAIEDSDTAPTALAGRLQADDAGVTSRLLCARKLESNQAYDLFLVPSYEVGRLAGLGHSTAVPPNPPTANAWNVGTAGPVILPVYFRSNLLTNAAEDLEVILRRLRAVSADDVEEIAEGPDVHAGRPGYYLDYNKPRERYRQQAATAAPDVPREGFSTEGNLTRRMAKTLKEVIRGESIDDGPAKDDPLVAFPAYGFRYRHETDLNDRFPGRYWFDQVNLDLKFREVAGLGAQVVRDHQDRFMRIAWSQYQEITKANAELARLQAAERLAERLSKRRFERLNSQTSLTLSEPLLANARSSEFDGGIVENFAGQGVPVAYVSRNMRRVAAKRIRPAPKGVGDARERDIPVPNVPGATEAQASPRAMLRRSALAGIGAPIDMQVNAQDRDRVMDLFGNLGMSAHAAPVPLFAAGRVALKDEAGRLSEVLKALPAAKAKFTVQGRDKQEEREVAPVWRAPRIDIPLVNFLVQKDRAAVARGLTDLPDNSIAFLEENRAFLEAFMVGANHEMNSELRWREFPTDMRGTVFKRFWQRGFGPGDPRGDDIDPIHGWTGALGSHWPSSDQDNAENLIMVMKGDVVRRLRLPLIELTISSTTTWKPDDGDVYAPVTFGKLGPDIVYYGFDISRETVMSDANRDRAFLNIYEPKGYLRFGLDVGSHQHRVGSQNLRLAKMAFPAVGMRRKLSGRDIPTLIPAPAPPTNSFQSWNDFSWAHVTTTPSDYVNFTGTTPRPASGPDHWGNGKNAASVAMSFWQRPLVAILPLGRVL